jgi:excisionase family DNA binding protein
MTHVELTASGAPLRPVAVPLKIAKQLLGNKSMSVIYEMIADGKLDAVKDGRKTLVVVESINRYMAALPSWRDAAVHKPVPKARPKKRTRRVKDAREAAAAAPTKENAPNKRRRAESAA